MNVIKTTENNPDGYSELPWFKTKGTRVYTTISHPEGYSGVPWYAVK